MNESSGGGGRGGRGGGRNRGRGRGGRGNWARKTEDGPGYGDQGHHYGPQQGPARYQGPPQDVDQYGGPHQDAVQYNGPQQGPGQYQGAQHKPRQYHHHQGQGGGGPDLGHHQQQQGRGRGRAQQYRGHRYDHGHDGFHHQDHGPDGYHYQDRDLDYGRQTHGGRGRGHHGGGGAGSDRQRRTRRPKDIKDVAPAAADIASELGRLALGETSTRVDNRAPAADTGNVDINENKSSGKHKGPRKKKAGVQDKDVSLRTRLTEVLVRGTHECMVCLDKVRQQQPTWDCRNCYQVFHFGCIKKWSRSATAEQHWRCPGCQVAVEASPRQYRCFCGKVPNPEWNRNEGLVPHTCGEVCGRPLGTAGSSCPHTCLDLCHPGPCSPCTATLAKTCPCGATTKRVKCEVALVCDQVCGRLLSCGAHTCGDTCHVGECAPCQVTLRQHCFCGQSSREVTCGPGVRGDHRYVCGQVCGNTLDCGHHTCESTCHEGPCAPCPLAPDKVTHCPCGKSSLSALAPARQLCTDPVAVCGAECGRVLSCGAPSRPHVCRAPCHAGPCPPCELETSVRCRCGAMDQDLPCTQLTSRADDARCQRKCQKKRSCGRHKCGELCCIRLEHPCPLLCNKLLSCKLHYCQDTCHAGKCRTCVNVSFSELTCHCGASVLYPPIACGTRPPECREPCRRHHACGHPVTHTCHSEERCPPCTTLTTKMCYGGHEERANIPCLVEGVSCGRSCGRRLPCGRHRCGRVCHPGECVQGGAGCSQPCPRPRAQCGHPCGAPCHEAECPDTACTTQVRLACECGRRQTSVPCSDNSFSKLSTSLLASQMADLRAGGSVDLAELARKNKKLECNEECHKIARNAKFAEALNLDNPELSSKVIPRYSDFMKDWVKKDSDLCSMVHTKLVDLVKLAKDSKQKSRSFSFPVMNRDKRQFVHEYAAHFGCESQSYDAEPKRNVVVTAVKEKCAIPSVSLLEAAGRQKKAPTPLPSKMMDSSSDALPTYTPLTRNGSDNKIDWFG